MMVTHLSLVPSPLVRVSSLATILQGIRDSGIRTWGIFFCLTTLLLPPTPHLTPANVLTKIAKNFVIENASGYF